VRRLEMTLIVRERAKPLTRGTDDSLLKGRHGSATLLGTNTHIFQEALLELLSALKVLRLQGSKLVK
jgi:hypothetical protein